MKVVSMLNVHNNGFNSSSQGVELQVIGLELKMC